jgi:hypothetical protein
MKTCPRILRYLTKRLGEIIIQDLLNEVDEVVELWVRDRVKKVEIYV